MKLPFELNTKVISFLTLLLIGIPVTVFLIGRSQETRQNANTSGGIEVSPTSGNWNATPSFLVKNINTYTVTDMVYYLDCWDPYQSQGKCSDSSGKVTLKPGESTTLGLGFGCYKWQLDLKSPSNQGFVVEVNQASCTQPTNTPVPATATPRPTNTPIPATSTPRPTNTPVPTVKPTNTPVPTVKPTNTPVPTIKPTNTPIPPTVTPRPTVTPTNTPKPTFTPTPTQVPPTIVIPTQTGCPVPAAVMDITIECPYCR